MKFAPRIILSLILLLGASCGGKPSLNQTLQLAMSTENRVTVAIMLDNIGNGEAILSATFTPQDPSLHLYTKDIPKTGLDGLGRPTLLELSKDSPMQAVSELMESAPPEAPGTPPFDLLIYPAGAVTLSLHILLPEGKDWLNDQVIVTYMACDEVGCRPPVQQKSIAIKIPGRELFQ